MTHNDVAMELKVELGPMPSSLDPCQALGGLRELLDKNQFCDVVLVAGGQSFSAHSMVLAASSAGFCQQIQQEHLTGYNRKPLTIHLSNVSHPEAVQDMLECIYGPCTDSREPCCKTESSNRDAIQLAQVYSIPQLQEQASRWLARGLTTHNVLVRLAICEEFGLFDVREKILEQLIADPVALPLLARDPEITNVPKVLQDLLVRILNLLGAGPDAQQVAAPQGKMQGKQARKAGA
jgi:hypothetical protein